MKERSFVELKSYMRIFWLLNIIRPPYHYRLEKSKLETVIIDNPSVSIPTL